MRRGIAALSVGCCGAGARDGLRLLGQLLEQLDHAERDDDSEDEQRAAA